MAVPREPNYKTYKKGGLKYDRVELQLEVFDSDEVILDLIKKFLGDKIYGI